MTGRSTETRLRRLEHTARRQSAQDRAALIAQIGTAYRRALASHGSHEAVAAGLGRISASATFGLAAMHQKGELA
jgi:hypothetical protein